MQNNTFAILIWAHVAFIAVAPIIALFFVNRREQPNEVEDLLGASTQQKKHRSRTKLKVAWN
jgi:hypothetical protein